MYTCISHVHVYHFENEYNVDVIVACIVEFVVINIVATV